MFSVLLPSLCPEPWDRFVDLLLVSRLVVRLEVESIDVRRVYQADSEMKPAQKVFTAGTQPAAMTMAVSRRLQGRCVNSDPCIPESSSRQGKLVAAETYVKTMASSMSVALPEAPSILYLRAMALPITALSRAPDVSRTDSKYSHK